MVVLLYCCNVDVKGEGMVQMLMLIGKLHLFVGYNESSFNFSP